MSSFLLSLVVLFSHSALTVPIPDCLDRAGTLVPINNEQVLIWKNSTRNQFLAQAHVKGVLIQKFSGDPGHQHFEIKIGNSSGDTLEVVYNTHFGRLPALAEGMIVEACGDYITANAPSGPYPASPDGAIIHWVHRSTKPSKHASGFLALDNVPFGL